MSVHTEFFNRLAQLVEYAETHDLEVPMLALNAALEVIAPNMVNQRVQAAMRMNTGTYARACPTVVSVRPAPRKLQVIQGGMHLNM